MKIVIFCEEKYIPQEERIFVYTSHFARRNLTISQLTLLHDYIPKSYNQVFENHRKHVLYSFFFPVVTGW